MHTPPILRTLSATTAVVRPPAGLGHRRAGAGPYPAAHPSIVMMVDELTMNQLGLFTPADLYAPPQHVDPRPPWCIVSQAILAALRGRYMHDPASELRRIPLLRTPMNKPPYHYADPFIDASSLRLNMRV